MYPLSVRRSRGGDYEGGRRGLKAEMWVKTELGFGLRGRFSVIGLYIHLVHFTQPEQTHTHARTQGRIQITGEGVGEGGPPQ